MADIIKTQNGILNMKKALVVIDEALDSCDETISLLVLAGESFLANSVADDYDSLMKKRKILKGHIKDAGG